MRVLYITGWCRSGSTLLGNLLGELPGVVHVGEVHYLWRNGVLSAGTNTSCGCGAAVSACPLWHAVIEKVAGPDPTAYGRRAIAEQRGYLRTRHTGRRLAEAVGRRPTPAPVGAALDRIIAIYRAITAVTGARLIVDSSKYPAEAAGLLGRPGLDLRVLHLVRDPRASAYSWRRAKAYIPAMGVSRSTAYWTAANLASDRIVRAAGPGRGMRLRYEDFTAHPHDTLAAVLTLAGRADPPPVDKRGHAVLGPNHTVTGNPDRLRHGPLRVRPDESWRSELPLGATLLATALAVPVIRRYRYGYHR